MREPGTGRPSPLVRMLAVLVVIAMVGITAPVLMPALRWFLGLF